MEKNRPMELARILNRGIIPATSAFADQQFSEGGTNMFMIRKPLDGKRIRTGHTGFLSI
jgi:hypothetical protein